MSLDQLGILRVMAIRAQSRAVLLQLEIEFPLASCARFMDGVAGLATRIQRGVVTTPFFDAEAYFMA